MILCLAMLATIEFTVKMATIFWMVAMAAITSMGVAETILYAVVQVLGITYRVIQGAIFMSSPQVMAIP